MPELEERVNRIERDYAGLDQRTTNMQQQLQTFASVPTQIVRFEGALQSLRDALSEIRREIKGIREGVDDRAKEQSEERRALKIALIGLTGVILAAVIGGTFVLIASHG